MIESKYGSLSSTQVYEVERTIQKRIFFLLLCVDPSTRNNVKIVDVKDAIEDVQQLIIGFNSLLCEDPELLMVMCYLEAALIEYQSNMLEYQKDDFDFKDSLYRKLILDAGSEIVKIKDGDRHD